MKLIDLNEKAGVGTTTSTKGIKERARSDAKKFSKTDRQNKPSNPYPSGTFQSKIWSTEFSKELKKHPESVTEMAAPSGYRPENGQTFDDYDEWAMAANQAGAEEFIREREDGFPAFTIYAVSDNKTKLWGHWSEDKEFGRVYIKNMRFEAGWRKTKRNLEKAF